MGQILCVLSNIMYLAEKFTMCLAAATVVSCLVLTLVMMLGLGVGLGYNYCFVEMKTKHRHVPGFYRYKVLEATTMHRTPPWRRITTTRRTTTRTTTTTSTTTTTVTPSIGSISQIQNRKQLFDYNPPTLEDIVNESDNDETKPLTEMTSEENYPYAETETGEASDISETTDTSENTDTSTTSKTILQLQGLDLIALLSKLRSENRNYTLQIVI